MLDLFCSLGNFISRYDLNIALSKLKLSICVFKVFCYYFIHLAGIITGEEVKADNLNGILASDREDASEMTGSNTINTNLTPLTTVFSYL